MQTKRRANKAALVPSWTAKENKQKIRHHLQLSASDLGAFSRFFIYVFIPSPPPTRRRAEAALSHDVCVQRDSEEPN